VEKLANFIYYRAKAIIALVVVLNIAAAVSFINFSINADFMSTFSEGNPKAEQFHQLNEKYSSGETITVLIESDTTLLSKENLRAIFNLQEEIESIDGITAVQGPLPPELFLGSQVIPIDADFITNNYEPLKDFIENRYFLSGQFLSEDKQNAVLIASLELDIPARDAIAALKDIAEESGVFRISLAGNEIIKDTLWSYLLRILFILPPIAILLILTVFFIVLRSRRLAAFSMLPAALAALWTFGTILYSGHEISMLTVITPLFIIIVGSAYGLHYVSHFIDNLIQYGSDQKKLVVETLKRVGKPIFLATITTMAGFASLIWTDVVPMRQMGIFVTIGIGYAGFLAIFFLPAVLSRLKPPAMSARANRDRLVGFVLAAQRYRVVIIAVFIIILGVSAVYIPRVDVVSNQLMFFKENSEIRQTFDRIEKDFGSALPLTGEIIAPNPRAALFDYGLASEILQTERELEAVSGIDSVMSAFDMLKGINGAITGQDDYPADPTFIQGLLSQVTLAGQQSWVSADGFRIFVKTRDMTTDDIDELESFVADHNNIRVVTGLPVLFNEMNRLVVRSQIQSLGLALVLVFIMLWITLRRITAAIAGLVPIGITIVAIIGFLSLAGFNLNIMTATLSAIAIGIGVDYSIHLLSGIYYYRDYGLSRAESVTSALSTVSRPILANALGLVIGYSALFFSPLRIHTHVASVMWVAMIVSSLAALLLVPIFYTRKDMKKAKVKE
jgi:predicted RND superfamily exporter protein